MFLNTRVGLRPRFAGCCTLACFLLYPSLDRGWSLRIFTFPILAQLWRQTHVSIILAALSGVCIRYPPLLSRHLYKKNTFYYHIRCLYIIWRWYTDKLDSKNYIGQNKWCICIQKSVKHKKKIVVTLYCWRYWSWFKIKNIFCLLTYRSLCFIWPIILSISERVLRCHLL